MALEFKLSQKLSQSLVMTPQLQQAIRLLQLGREDYLEEIDKAILENPLLEDVREAERFEPPPSDKILPFSETDTQARLDVQTKPAEGSSSDFANIFEIYQEAYSGPQYSKGNFRDGDEERPTLESSVALRLGLGDHLLWQIRTGELTGSDRDIATFIIGNLDSRGYLSMSVEEIAVELKLPISDVEGVLMVLQSLDPPGVCARDLKECLLIQLSAKGYGESLAARIIVNGLERLETKRYDSLAREFNVSVEDVYAAVKIIQKLEPRPGRPFLDEEPIYITPDIFVRKIEGQWKISLNEAGMPRLRLSKKYQELVNSNSKETTESDYLQEKVRSASWLIRSIQQRQQTIFRVAECVMQFQRDFLDQGTGALKPLVLREVAEQVQMHESTVSRVTTNKYIHTPHGVFELKYFFSSGLNSSEGNISSEAVKERIRNLVANENPKLPLSDQALAECLKKEGIDVARRTVAKYREMMAISSSSSRKKVF